MPLEILLEILLEIVLEIVLEILLEVLLEIVLVADAPEKGLDVGDVRRPEAPGLTPIQLQEQGWGGKRLQK